MLRYVQYALPQQAIPIDRARRVVAALGIVRADDLALALSPVDRKPDEGQRSFASPYRLSVAPQYVLHGVAVEPHPECVFVAGPELHDVGGRIGKQEVEQFGVTEDAGPRDPQQDLGQRVSVSRLTGIIFIRIEQHFGRVERRHFDGTDNAGRCNDDQQQHETTDEPANRGRQMQIRECQQGWFPRGCPATIISPSQKLPLIDGQQESDLQGCRCRHRRRKRARRANQAHRGGNPSPRGHVGYRRVRRAFRSAAGPLPGARAGLRHRWRRDEAEARPATRHPRYDRNRPRCHVRQRCARSGGGAFVFPRLFCLRETGHRGGCECSQGHRGGLQPGRRCPDRWRDRRDAGHVCRR